MELRFRQITSDSNFYVKGISHKKVMKFYQIIEDPFQNNFLPNSYIS